ncbi:MAG: L,D-transpeptidase [Patescibacteria group bacterium]
MSASKRHTQVKNILYSKSNFFICLLCLAILFFVITYFVGQSTKDKLFTNVFEESLGDYDKQADMGYFLGKNFQVPNEITKVKSPVLGNSTPDNKWIEVDLSEQKLRAWDGGSLFLETLVSTGLPYFPTPQGEFRIWYKIRYTRMRGGEGRYAYNLPNVPYVMFFENGSVPGYRGYGLHGTYWHSDFGTVHSHGCVNLPTPIAERLYYWTTPVLGSSNVVRSNTDNPGTKIIIHE